MQFIISAATLLLAASAMASPTVRRQTEADTKVRIILRDDVGGKSETVFGLVESNLSTGVSGTFTTIEVDVGADVNPALRCAVTADDGVQIVANRGANRDTTFSDATKGEWRFDGPTDITVVRCDVNFVANNQNAA